jgi:ABC-type multidrug transport system fused ATPase/permease subunit
LGRTGSGKSTLARLLFRLVDPQVGSIRVGGVELREAQIRSLRNRIGFVTQDVQLFEATLRENITCFAPNVPDERLLELMEMLGLGAWLARLSEGLDTPISTSTLSAGEAQLVALARVFLKDPGLIILDEASSRLDPATEALLERALDRLLEGRTALIIAHRLATLDRATDILVLEEGHIVEHGPRQELANDPTSRFAGLRYAGTGELLI